MKRGKFEYVVFFSEPEDLEELTGLTHEELWDNGFNLDDMDWGIETNEEWKEGAHYSRNAPYYRDWMLNRMGSHCVGYHHTEYKGKHYYTVHHA